MQTVGPPSPNFFVASLRTVHLIHQSLIVSTHSLTLITDDHTHSHDYEGFSAAKYVIVNGRMTTPPSAVL